MTHPHVLLLCHSLRGGGAERATITLARALVRKQTRVSILLRELVVDYDIDFPVHLDWLGNPPTVVTRLLRPYELEWQRRALRRKYQELSEQIRRPNLVLSSLPPPDRLGARARLPNTYCLVHNTLSQRLARKRSFVRRRYLRRYHRTYHSQHIIAVSEGAAHDFIHRLGVRPRSIRTIYNPIDIEWIRECSKRDSRPLNEDYLIHVGRFDAQKRHDVLLYAFAEAKWPKRLVLLGSGPQERLRELQRLCDALGISDRVSFMGFKPNPYPWIRHARLLVLSSDYEGMSLVIAEALACGTPVASTDCESGPRELLTGELKRGLVPVGNAQALAEAIDDLWLSPPTVPASAVSRFSAESVAEQYLKLCH